MTICRLTTILECVPYGIDSDSRPNAPCPAACELHSARTSERATAGQPLPRPSWSRRRSCAWLRASNHHRCQCLSARVLFLLCVRISHFCVLLKKGAGLGERIPVGKNAGTIPHTNGLQRVVQQPHFASLGRAVAIRPPTIQNDTTACHRANEKCYFRLN